MGCFDRLSTNGWVWAQRERLGMLGNASALPWDSCLRGDAKAGAWGDFDRAREGGRTVGCAGRANGGVSGTLSQAPHDEMVGARGVLRQAHDERVVVFRMVGVGVERERGRVGLGLRYVFVVSFCDAPMGCTVRTIRMIWSGGLLSITRGTSQAIHTREGRYGFSFVRSFLPGWRHF